MHWDPNHTQQYLILPLFYSDQVQAIDNYAAYFSNNTPLKIQILKHLSIPIRFVRKAD